MSHPPAYASKLFSSMRFCITLHSTEATVSPVLVVGGVLDDLMADRVFSNTMHAQPEKC
jgi:hypothetical protein